MKYLMLIAALVLAGCSNGRPNYDLTEVNKPVQENTVKIFAGIPVALGMEGSAARLNDEWMVTAAHNWPIMLLTTVWDYHKHPTCDIVLFRSKDTNTVPLARGHFGEEVTFVGYPMGHPMAANKGTIVGNVEMTDYPDCTKVATNAVVVQGMSGGGVYNNDGALIGIVHGYTSDTMRWPDGKSLKNGGVYMQLSTVADWIYEITGVEL